MSDPVRDLLFRDTIEIVLTVDVAAARDLPDDLMQETLGLEALLLLRREIEEADA